MLIIYNI